MNRKYTITDAAAKRICASLAETLSESAGISYKDVVTAVREEGFRDSHIRGVIQHIGLVLPEGESDRKAGHYRHIAILIGLACASQAHTAVTASRGLLCAIDDLRVAVGSSPTEDIYD